MKDCTWFIGTLVVLVMFMILIMVVTNIVVFEDGSFILFETIGGCLPGGVCNIN